MALPGIGDPTSGPAATYAGRFRRSHAGRPGTVGQVILFVCTGNTCRSAMAEALLRTRLAERAGENPAVASAGTAVRDHGGTPVGATPEAVEVLAERGIDLTGHAGTPLTGELLASADLVVAMTCRHEAAVGALDAVARSRTFLAGEVVRLGGQVGPRGDRTVGDWIRALGGARGGHFTTGRVADEVADPWGEPVEEYQRCADRLDGICTGLAHLLM